MARSSAARGLFFWSVVAGLVAAGIAAVGAILAFWLSSGGWIGEPTGRDPGAATDAIKIGLTAAAGAGAAVALVVAFRRQKLLEEDREGELTKNIAEASAGREIQRAMHERYQAATAQLGHENLTIRLAGVYALTAVADDWLARDDRGQAQVCVDVLCSYLRTGKRDEDGSQPDVEVRQTITRVIASHLQPDAAPSWSDFDFDFTGAVFTGRHSFERAVFKGGTVSFAGVEFSGLDVSFNRVTLASAVVSFEDAVISGRLVTFAGADLGSAHFDGAVLSAKEVSFAGAQFSSVSFEAAQFNSGTVYFVQARFTGVTSFYEAAFVKGRVNFNGCEFEQPVDFGDVEFAGARLSFEAAAFRDEVTFHGVGFSSGEVVFDEATWSAGGYVSFDRARPSDGKGVVKGPWPGPPEKLPRRYPPTQDEGSSGC